MYECVCNSEWLDECPCVATETYNIIVKCSYAAPENKPRAQQLWQQFSIFGLSSYCKISHTKEIWACNLGHQENKVPRGKWKSELIQTMNS
jgi:hypothetical protein